MDSTLVLLVVGAAVALIVVALAMMLSGGRKEKLGGRFQSLSDAPQERAVTSRIVKKKKSQGENLRDSFTEHVLRPLSGMMGVTGGQGKLRELLVYAGIRRKGAVEVFLGLKLIMILGMPFVTAAFLIFWWVSNGDPIDGNQLFIFAACAGVLGMILPNMWLKRKVRLRQEDIRCSLPDALDLMVVCIEAGLGIDAAFLKISDDLAESAPQLCEELSLLNLELRAGKPREECLRNFGLRTGVEEVKSLTARIIQATKFGVNLASSLRVHSESLRLRRRQAAEEKAAKTTIKLLFPLVFFIFPAIFVVILGPALIKIQRTLGIFD